MPSLHEAIRSMFETGSTSVVADHLDTLGDSSAPVVRSMSAPTEALRFLAPELDNIGIVFDLPVKDLDKLDIALRHSATEDHVLFTLACDFATHVLPIYEEWNEFDTRPSELLQSMRDWINGTNSDETLRISRNALCSRPAYDKIQRIPEASRAVVSTIMRATNPWALATHCVAAFNAYNTAEFARNAAGDDEMIWQLDHARIVLHRKADDTPNAR
jgi:hypothetical protein